MNIEPFNAPPQALEEDHNKTLTTGLLAAGAVACVLVFVFVPLTVGSHFTFYINGARVDELDAGLPTPGRIGLETDMFEAGQEATIVFDNLRVYTP